MGGFGWHNSFPFSFGGEPTAAETVWRSLRKAMGDAAGGVVGPEGGLEDSWRQVKATAIATATGAVERAATQAYPHLATDHLEVYETLLDVPQAPTDVERRAAVATAYTETLSAVIPTLIDELAAIDPALVIEFEDEPEEQHVVMGKTLGPRAGQLPAFSVGATAAVQSAEWPNFSTSFVLHVRYTHALGALPSAEQLAAIERMLCRVLPAWFDFVLYNDVGFYCDGGPDDTSRLDLTAFD